MVRRELKGRKEGEGAGICRHFSAAVEEDDDGEDDEECDGEARGPAETRVLEDVEGERQSRGRKGSGVDRR